MTQQFVQGDVMFIKRISPIRKSNMLTGEAFPSLPATDGKHIIQRGEKTGHMHVADATAPDLFKFSTGRVAVVKQPTWITHDEHEPLQLEEGEYDVVIQTQYVPREMPRMVFD